MLDPDSSSVDSVSSDVIDFALLAAIVDRPCTPLVAIQRTRDICRPWLHPTIEVLDHRLVRHRRAGRLTAAKSDHLHLTGLGHSTLRQLLLHGVPTHSHILEELVESVRVALAGQLEPEARKDLYRALLQGRDACVEAQLDRLTACAASGDAVESTIRYAVSRSRACRAALSIMLDDTCRDAHSHQGVRA